MLRIVVALEAEARPLVARFALAPLDGVTAFRVYRQGTTGDATAGTWLIVSGLGKAAAAAATSYLHLCSGGREDCVWLNVGIAGHDHLDLGSAVVAERVTDQATGRTWRSSLPVPSPCPTAPLLTVDKVQEEYPLPVVYEMEAAGFVATARRFSAADLVHCFKVISDRPGSPLALAAEGSPRLATVFVEELIQTALPDLQKFAARLVKLARRREAGDAAAAD